MNTTIKPQAAPALAPLKLSDAAGRAAEAEGGFNIEGLAAAVKARRLWIVCGHVRQLSRLEPVAAHGRPPAGGHPLEGCHQLRLVT